MSEDEMGRIVERILGLRRKMAPDLSTTNLIHILWWEDGVRTMANAAIEVLLTERENH